MTTTTEDGASRRLLKLHAASTRAASAQARALCVGPSRVVFRVALVHASSDAAWVTALSEASCLRVLSATRDAMRDAIHGRLARTLRGLLRGMLKRAGALAATAFSSQFSANTSRRQRIQRNVEAFVSDCWAALSLLLLLSPKGGNGGTYKRLCALLSELLAVPRRIVVAHDANARAIRSLESAATTTTMCHCVCCVCLDTLGEKCTRVVRLPCRHELHEDCALTWLARKPSCPHCRMDLCQRSRP